jgi:zinc D-Ala-D-Ala carboxypeptidase
MRLSPNFTLAELTISETAARHGLDNTPPQEVIENLKLLAQSLQEVRAALGNKVIIVTSAYRSPQVNSKVGGSKNSDHTRGLAADIIVPSFGTPNDVVSAILASGIPFKQVIREFDRWTHFAIPAPGEAPRRQALIIDRQGTRAFA